MARTPEIAKQQAIARARARAVAEAKAKARAEARARAEANARAAGAKAAGAETAEFRPDRLDQAVANPQSPPIIAQDDSTLPPPPELDLVQPGDLITAQYINNLVAAVQDLQVRMELLESPDDSGQAGGNAA